jgi:spore maturation protein B
MLCNALSPIFTFWGIPTELTKLILIKPFSGSGSLAYLTEIIKNYGADSYISRCACVLYGSSETVFYISAVYFAKSKNKKRILPIIIILLSTFICAIFACKLCKIA